MKKRLSLILAALVVLNAIQSSTFAWESPLKKYNLYDDVMGTSNSSKNSERERAMGEFYENSLDKKLKSSNKKNKAQDYSSYDLNNFNAEPAATKTRNETLRESSREVYSDQESTPAWLDGPSFYPEPSFDSIVEKYHRSDFAGCLQECISYVRKNPNDTLGYYYLAMAYTKCSDKDNAVRAYEKVIELNDNPMIVKYATNGRNCILGSDDAPCYQNVNEPEYLRPYADLVINMQPINPQTLIDRNLSRLQKRLDPLYMERLYVEEAKSILDSGDEENINSYRLKELGTLLSVKDIDKAESKEKLIEIMRSYVDNYNPDDSNDKTKNSINLPFGKQDEELDRFINAPYGNGLSPELNKQYKQLQLKKIQESINKSEDSTPDKKQHNLFDIKKFDKQKSDSDTIKLAYEPSAADMESIMKDPEYIRQKQELDELNLLLGNDKSKDNSDIMDLLPYMTEGDKKLSPEVIQSMMIKSMMGNITL